MDALVEERAFKLFTDLWPAATLQDWNSFNPEVRDTVLHLHVVPAWRLSHAMLSLGSPMTTPCARF